MDNSSAKASSTFVELQEFQEKGRNQPVYVQLQPLLERSDVGPRFGEHHKIRVFLVSLGLFNNRVT